MRTDVRTIELTEYARAELPAAMLPLELGEMLWRGYGDKIAVEFPSPKNGGRWRLTSLGWVGMIPLAPGFRIMLHPKVRLSNLFRMLEYAYRLRSFRFLDGLYECESIEEFYSQLAAILARRVLDRERRGLYHEYVATSGTLPYLRGSLDVRRTAIEPAHAGLHCDYHDSTPDIEDNRIIAHTLRMIARCGLCDERTVPVARRASGVLQGHVTSLPVSAAHCSGRSYNRLNEDYRPLHALCRFFLEQSGPAHQSGDREMIPFLIDMGKLFEMFVAEWLRAHLPDHIGLAAQEMVSFGEHPFHFSIDLVLSDAGGRALAVADTKYKVPRSPSAADVAQTIAYAEAKRCRDAFLIYPIALASPLDTVVGEIRVRSLAFRLDGELEEGGKEMMRGLVGGMRDEG
jgi:5-methylcytosine-specific restriction enzyme subunit McrC